MYPIPCFYKSVYMYTKGTWCEYVHMHVCRYILPSISMLGVNVPEDRNTARKKGRCDGPLERTALIHHQLMLRESPSSPKLLSLCQEATQQNSLNSSWTLYAKIGWYSLNKVSAMLRSFTVNLTQEKHRHFYIQPLEKSVSFTL